MPVTPPAGDSDNHIAYYVRSTVPFVSKLMFCHFTRVALSIKQRLVEMDIANRIDDLCDLNLPITR